MSAVCVAPQDAKRFTDFGSVLPSWLASGLERGGFDCMKPIQQRVLPLALLGKDVAGIAPTGSGKTLAFLVPGIVHAAGQSRFLKPADGPIVLILVPTRELAIQIGSVAESLLESSKMSRHGGLSQRMNSAVIYGGPRRSDQLQSLRFQKGTHLAVATPGRLLDFLRHGAFGLKHVSFFVLDEGDRMLDEGFEPDVTAISATIRSDRQMLFFSATWPDDVERVANRLCCGQAFHRVSVDNGELSPPGTADDGAAMIGQTGLTLPPREIRQLVEVIKTGLDHWSYEAALEKKMPLLLKYLEEPLHIPNGKAIIFVSSRNAADSIGDIVTRRFSGCGVMHGRRKQDQRESTLRAFREGRLRCLVSTDVLGRGVDIANVSHVIVFDFPGDIETYIHRVGRTGRNGQSGTSIAFFEPQPWYPHLARELADVLRQTGQELPPALVEEENQIRSCNQQEWGAGMWPRHAPWQTSAPHRSLPEPPPLEERGQPPLATADELCDWDACGARVWGYSANGGQSEQGRLEFRTGGLLRTSWGWGEWGLVHPHPHVDPPSRPCPPLVDAVAPALGQLLAQGPHCPPPSRACPPLTDATDPVAIHEVQVPTMALDCEKEGVEYSATSVVPVTPTAVNFEKEGAESSTAAVVPINHHLALTWGGTTDIVMLAQLALALSWSRGTAVQAVHTKKQHLAVPCQVLLCEPKSQGAAAFVAAAFLLRPASHM
eukprot:CAMPEP_0172839428 /NCGR_PEP_ID=MMETSP1075-20121228/28552_1 /TAXON_ID=2916 /ORGANISM="Ceratium fusus, Strain PA161109" /LENGTH=714 /DNA_ID=CAMNT_0013683077 /DNA_START=263 /DNA_END=2408 /DNA_ORIENTATION=+